MAIAAGCIGLGVSMGLLASAYTTAGLDPFYRQQRERADDVAARAAIPARESWAADSGDAEPLSYPPIPNPG